MSVVVPGKATARPFGGRSAVLLALFGTATVAIVFGVGVLMNIARDYPTPTKISQGLLEHPEIRPWYLLATLSYFFLYLLRELVAPTSLNHFSFTPDERKELAITLQVLEHNATLRADRYNVNNTRVPIRPVPPEEFRRKRKEYAPKIAAAKWNLSSREWGQWLSVLSALSGTPLTFFVILLGLVLPGTLGDLHANSAICVYAFMVGWFYPLVGVHWLDALRREAAKFGISLGPNARTAILVVETLLAAAMAATGAASYYVTDASISAQLEAAFAMLAYFTFPFVVVLKV